MGGFQCVPSISKGLMPLQKWISCTFSQPRCEGGEKIKKESNDGIVIRKADSYSYFLPLVGVRACVCSNVKSQVTYGVPIGFLRQDTEVV